MSGLPKSGKMAAKKTNSLWYNLWEVHTYFLWFMRKFMFLKRFFFIISRLIVWHCHGLESGAKRVGPNTTYCQLIVWCSLVWWLYMNIVSWLSEILFVIKKNCSIQFDFDKIVSNKPILNVFTFLEYFWGLELRVENGCERLKNVN